MTRRLTALATSLTLAAAALAGCGGDKPPGIPRGDASELIRLLRTAQRQADDPARCNDLLSTVRSLERKAARVPKSTDSDVRDSLDNGVRNLASSARSQCRKAKRERTTPDTTPTIPTVPPSTTDGTPTVPPATTDTTPTTPPPTTPPSNTTPTPPVTPTSPGTGGASPGGSGGQGPGQGKGHKNGKGGKGKDRTAATTGAGP